MEMYISSRKTQSLGKAVSELCLSAKVRNFSEV